MAVLGFAWFRLAAGLRLPESSVSASSRCRKPVHPHQKHWQVVDSQPEREFALCFWWRWRDSNSRPARIYFNISAAFRLPYDHVHCRPTKARLWMAKNDPVHMKQCWRTTITTLTHESQVFGEALTLGRWVTFKSAYPGHSGASRCGQRTHMQT